MDKNTIIERLDKDTYSKDEVAGLIQAEKEYTTRTISKNMVAREDFDSISGELENTKAQLAPYKQKEFNEVVSSEFTKLNGNPEMVDDLVKISGLTMEDTPEIISEKIASIKETGKYDNFLFTKPQNSGAGHANTQINLNNKPVAKDTVAKYGWLNKLGGIFNK